MCLSQLKRYRASMTYWLLVTSEQNWRICYEHKTWGVSPHFASTIESVQSGDEMLVHISGMRTAGIIRATSRAFYDTAKLWNDGVYPYRIKFEPILILPELRDVRDFYESNFPTKDARGYFGRSMRFMPKNEFLPPEKFP